MPGLVPRVVAEATQADDGGHGPRVCWEVLLPSPRFGVHRPEAIASVCRPADLSFQVGVVDEYGDPNPVGRT